MRILVVLNGSPQDDMVLDWCAQYTPQAYGPVTLLTIIDEHKEVATTWPERILAQARQRLSLPHLQTRIRIGSADEEITQEAREGECDLVVIGQARAPRVVESFRGSLSERLARRLHCSLLILRAPAHPIERILLCDSGADNSKTVRRFAARLSELLPSEVQVTVLHVMSQISAGPGVRGEQLRAGAEKLILEHSPEGELLEGDVQVLGKLNLHPSPKVRHGLVVDEILSEACSGGYDLVIIGSHQNAGWQRFLLDDLAQKIIDGLDRSVLVVK